MDKQKKKRSENWSPEEKELLRKLISESKDIIENKCTKTEINLNKRTEWKNILMKLNKLTGKTRKEDEIRLAWKRMKMTAKNNNVSVFIPLIRHQTGVGENPQSPSQYDQAVINICRNDDIPKTKEDKKIRKDTKINSIIEMNMEHKKKSLELMEIEHSYNVTVAKLKIRKLELEIELLENKRSLIEE